MPVPGWRPLPVRLPELRPGPFLPPSRGDDRPLGRDLARVGPVARLPVPRGRSRR